MSRAEIMDELREVVRDSGVYVYDVDGDDCTDALVDSLLDTLLSPSTTSCETCHGSGQVITPVQHGDNMTPCPAGCIDGQVHREPYMVLREDLEQIDVPTFYRFAGRDYYESPEPLFRFVTGDEDT